MADAPILASLEHPELPELSDSGSAPAQQRSRLGLSQGWHDRERDDLRQRLTAAVAADDYDEAQRVLEPIVKEIAGEEWQLLMSDEGYNWCEVGQRTISVGWIKSGKKRSPEVVAFDVYISLIHELGHVIYTPERPDYYAGRQFVSAAYYSQASTNPEQLGMDFNWLDNVFADSRHRAQMRREHPEQAGAVDWDRIMTLEYSMIQACAYANVEVPDDRLSAHALAALPAQEQVGMLMLAELCGRPLDSWLEVAADEAVQCFAYLRPYLAEVRDGKEVEYVEHLSPCYRVLTKHALMPESGPASYRSHQDYVSYDAISSWMAESLKQERVPASDGPVHRFSKAALRRQKRHLNALKGDLIARLSDELGRPSLPNLSEPSKEVAGAKFVPRADPELAY